MRVWLDPAKIANRGLTASDIVTALRGTKRTGRRRFRRAAAGGLRRFSDDGNTLGRLTSEEQFGEIVVKSALTAR